MAWQKVKCSKCDSEYQVQMYGPHNKREWKAANWTGTCDECKAHAVNEAVADNTNNALATLTGSGKQISWAMSIRDKFAADWAAIKLRLPPSAADDIIDIDAIFVEQTQAIFWIDHRNMSFERLCKDLDVLGD